MSKEKKAHITIDEERAALAYAVEIQTKFHLPEPLHFLCDVEAGHIEKLSRTAVAWYEPATDIIHVNTERMKTICEAEGLDMKEYMGATIFHEAVGHYGLRLLLGEKFNDTMTHVYDHADGLLKSRLMEKRLQLEDARDAKGHAIYRTMPEQVMKVLTVEELMSDMAEQLHSLRPRNRTLRQRLAMRLSEALKAVFMPFCKVTTRDLEVMLEKSYRKVTSRSWVGRRMDWLIEKAPFMSFLQPFFAKHTPQSKERPEREERPPSIALSFAKRILIAAGFILFPYITVPVYLFSRVRHMAKSDVGPKARRSPAQLRMPIAKEILNTNQCEIELSCPPLSQETMLQARHQKKDKNHVNDNERTL